MTTPLREQHPEYAEKLHRLNVLENAALTHGLRPLEEEELWELQGEVDAIELAFAHEVRQASPFEIVCTDYELQIEQYGDYGGTEL